MKTTILKLVVLNHLCEDEWSPIGRLAGYFNNSVNMYQYMKGLVDEGLVEHDKRIALRTNGSPTMMSVYRLTDVGLNTLKESKVYLLREVISDEGGVCV